MKKLLFILSVIFTTVSGCNKPVKGDNGITYKNPVEYNDYIVKRQTDLMRKVVSFGEAAQFDIDSAANLLTGYTSDTEKIIEEIRGMPPYKGDSLLRNAAVRSFTFYKRVFEKDYMDIIQIRRRGDSTYLSQEDVVEMERIVKKIEKEEKDYDEAFQAAQKAFAKKNNMRLRENEMQKEMEEKIKAE